MLFSGVTGHLGSQNGSFLLQIPITLEKTPYLNATIEIGARKLTLGKVHKCNLFTGLEIAKSTFI